MISLQTKGLTEFSPTPQFKSISYSVLSLFFFMVQFSHLYMTTGKTIPLTIWTFVGKVLSLLFNTLSRFVRAFLPRSKCFLISWLQSQSAVILEPKKIVYKILKHYQLKFKEKRGIQRREAILFPSVHFYPYKNRDLFDSLRVKEKETKA